MKPPNQGVAAWARTGSRPLILGHRGARYCEPENTLRAFERAMAEGADGVELDVRLTADGHVVVMHDATLTRMTEGRVTRRVDELRLSDVTAVELVRGTRAPSLSEVLSWAAAAKARVNIEVKQDVRALAALTQAVIRLVASQRDAPEWLELSSFHPGVVHDLAKALPECVVGWLVHRGQQVLRAAPGFGWLGARAVHAELPLCTNARLAHWKTRGALVAVWTVNDAESARRLAASGVDVLISDEPGVIVEALAPPAASSAPHDA